MRWGGDDEMALYRCAVFGIVTVGILTEEEEIVWKGAIRCAGNGLIQEDLESDVHKPDRR